MPNPVRRFARLPLALAICAMLARALLPVGSFAAAHPAPGPAMEKYVSPHGDFVVYRPVGAAVIRGSLPAPAPRSRRARDRARRPRAASTAGRT